MPAEERIKAKAVATQLKRRALALGLAYGFEYAAQFLLPVVLARCLDATAFGEYRLLWLAVGTLMAASTLAMPTSLYYFLPRSDAATKRLYVNQTILYLAAVGLIAAWAVSPWNPWLPEKMEAFARHGAIVPAFILLWLIAYLLDVLPTVEERVAWQAKITVGLAALRVVALSLTAALTHDLASVFVVLLLLATLKIALLGGYVATQYGLGPPIFRKKVFGDQLKYAIPFGISGALYDLRGHADQWVVAALFSLSSFAAFSIGVILGPLVNLFRQAVNWSFMPSMSRLQAAGDISAMLDLNQRANVMVGTFVYPLLAFAFMFADDIVTFIYTDKYVAAASVMRVYIVSLAALVIETASITFLLRQGTFVMRVNLVMLLLAVPTSWLLAQHVGLIGPAIGSVVAVYLDRALNLWRISRLTDIRVRRLQDWRSLSRTILFAVLAGAPAWFVVDRYLDTRTEFVQLAVGGAILAVVYGTLYVLFGIRRGWFASANSPGHGL